MMMGTYGYNLNKLLLLDGACMWMLPTVVVKKKKDFSIVK